MGRRVEIELPDFPEWNSERVIQIFAGIEFVAYQYVGENWHVKITRCNQCGECCRRLPSNHRFPLIDETCIHLQKELGDNDMWFCGLRMSRPFGCSIGEPNLKDKKDYCCVEWKELE